MPRLCLYVVRFLVLAMLARAMCCCDRRHRDDSIPNSTWVPLEYPGQIAHWIRNIHEDKAGNLWFSTNHYGTLRYNGIQLEYLSEQYGFSGERASSRRE